MPSLQPHLNIKKGDIAPYVLLPGDPGRIKRIIKYWDTAREVAYQREFLTYAGTYKGIPVSATSTGIGAPSASIAVEELANVGAKIFIRIGTCGALKKEIQPGNLIIPDKALRQDGTTKEYVDDDYEALPDQEIFQALKKSAQELRLTYFVGINRSHDAFYETPKNFINLINTPEYRTGKLISSEMECSSVFTVARLRGLRSGAVLGVNTTEPLDEIAKNPDLIYQLETSPAADQGVENTILVALKAIEFLAKQS
jgi:uridine phosphorylase